MVASDKPPGRGVITQGQEGVLVPFFDQEALVERTCALLDDPAERARLGQAARRKVVSQFDLQSICLPAQLDWVKSLL